MIIRWFAAVALLVCACPTPPVLPVVDVCDPDDDVVIDDLPADFLAALDDWAVRCEPANAALASVESEFTTEQLIVSFGAAFSDELAWRDAWRSWRVLDAGAVGFRRGGLGCIQERLLDATYDLDALAETQAVLVARLGASDPCVLAAECSVGTCAADALSPCGKTCRDATGCADDDNCGLLDSCVDEGDCANGLACRFNACRADDGGLCRTDGDCAGFVCVDGTCGQSAVGEGCDEDDDCVSAACFAGRCADRRAEGGSCVDNDDCNFALGCVDGTCRTRSGDACDDATDCVGPAACVDGVCAPVRAVGATCDDANECEASTFCEPVSGRCQPLRVAGEPSGYITPDARCAGNNGLGRCETALRPDRCNPFSGDEVCAVVDEGACAGIDDEVTCSGLFSTRECIYDDATSTSTCGDRRQLGELCITDDVVGSGGSCAIGLRCELSANSFVSRLGRCATLPGAGDACFGPRSRCDARVARCDAFTNTCIAYDDYAFFVPDEASCATR